ncbi:MULTISPECIES: hypothetical protein [Niastella]|uniref:Uncharacterized protein n=1 Tax=Niastella soli TaxID=2821487 RepID=A0ABS3YYU4_9BACT|nr:hypothetical protein [Niastella soli]MBO9203099.1 hypothetical protein [Niastella soli]
MNFSSLFVLLCILTAYSYAPNPKQIDLHNLLVDTSAATKKIVNKSDTQILNSTGDTIVLQWQEEEKSDTFKR